MHITYEARDNQGAVLYIGTSSNPGQRFRDHARKAPWWSNVATLELRTYPDREHAAMAEAALICELTPTHNVQCGGAKGAPNITRSRRWFDALNRYDLDVPFNAAHVFSVRGA